MPWKQKGKKRKRTLHWNEANCMKSNTHKILDDVRMEVILLYRCVLREFFPTHASKCSCIIYNEQQVKGWAMYDLLSIHSIVQIVEWNIFRIGSNDVRVFSDFEHKTFSANWALTSFRFHCYRLNIDFRVIIIEHGACIWFQKIEALVSWQYFPTE